MEQPIDILKHVKQLPTLPTVYTSLCEVIDNPNTTIGDVVRVLSNDQSTVSSVLRLVNSVFYGLQNRVDTVSQAVILLGLEEVRNLVLATSVMKLFSKEGAVLDFQPAKFWGHAIATGLAARYIAQEAGVTDLENFYVSGLLHDMGKLFLFEYVSKEFGHAVRMANEIKITIGKAEMQVMETDHTEVGYLLADMWKLPSTICDVIRYHDDFEKAPGIDKLIAAVHIANFLVRALDLGYPGDDLIPMPDPRAWDILKLPPKTFKKIVPTLVREYQDLTTQMLKA